MRLKPTAGFLLGFLLILFVASLGGCVTAGPVTTGPYTTERVQKQAYQGIDNNSKIAARAILAKYEEKMGRMWRIWKRGDDKLAAKTIPAATLAKMTPDQVQIWSNEVGKQRLRIAQHRDDVLATYDQTRAQELAQVADNASQSKDAVLNIVETWQKQGEISKLTFENVTSAVVAGLSTYQQLQHIKKLRDEAEQAAKDQAAEETQLEAS